jgi:diacylglycerol kinase
MRAVQMVIGFDAQTKRRYNKKRPHAWCGLRKGVAEESLFLLRHRVVLYMIVAICAVFARLGR